MCRLSIVVPYDRDEAAFETSLVSVLENRPEYCEVIVAHDGRYHDPFDLGDEVRFVIAPAADSITLIRTAVNAAMGRVVHVMMGGARATENWSEEPVSLFEQADLGCVAPVIRDLSDCGSVIAAGWRDANSRLLRPIAKGLKSPSRRDVAGIQGAYLAASFWRKSALESFLQLPLPNSVTGSEYVLATALAIAGWRCRLASSSNVLSSTQFLVPADGFATNWATIQNLRVELGKDSGLSAATSALLGVVTSPLQFSAWSEFCGRLQGAFSKNQSTRKLAAQLREVCSKAGPHAVNEQILKMPNRPVQAQLGRRAA